MLLKLLHISCAALSITGFFIRGIWMIQQSPQLSQRWVKIAPHIIDTILLASAIALALHWQLSPLQQPWLMAKIIALIAYIGLGTLALKRAKTRQLQISCWLLALLCFGYIVSVAITKSPMGFF